MTGKTAGKLQQGGVEQEEEDQEEEEEEMVRGPDLQDLHHSPLDQVCRLTHEPPV